MIFRGGGSHWLNIENSDVNFICEQIWENLQVYLVNCF